MPTPRPPVYSKRLGAIADEQFDAACSRAGVGSFVRAAPTTSGLFGQNVFVTTSEGEFVLRGAPHWVDFADSGPWNFEPNDLWQFTKEHLFARLLAEKTDAPVPWPQWLDKTADIFGWPYILMPRMPGHCFDERSIRKTISSEGRRGIARALGDGLAEQQRLHWPFAGDVDPKTYALTPYRGGYAAHTARQTRRFADNARANGRITAEDDAWIVRVIDTALGHDGSRPSVFVHGDFKLSNLCVTEREGAWAMSGLFDLHEARFGEGAADLCRQICSYLDTDDALAPVFLDAYRARTTLDGDIDKRMPLYVINERMKIWEYFTRPDVDAGFLRDKTFRHWAERYVTVIGDLL